MRNWGNLSVPLKPSPWGEGGWPSGQTDEGAMIERFRFLQGDFAACGRRVTFSTMRKSPKNRRGTAQDERLRAHIRLSPGPPFTRAANAEVFLCRKGAGSSADWFPLVFRCRSLGNHRNPGTPLVDSAFVRVGLNCGSVRRRTTDRLLIPVGTAHLGHPCPSLCAHPLENR